LLQVGIILQLQFVISHNKIPKINKPMNELYYQHLQVFCLAKN